MAHVVDPNSWRMFSVPDSDSPRTPADTLSSSQRPVRSAKQPFDTRVLNSVLARSFSHPRDEVRWHLALDPADANGRQLRLDGSHPLAVPAGSYANAAMDPPAEDETPWLVVVEDAEQLHEGIPADRLTSGPEHDAQLLLVLCDGKATGLGRDDVATAVSMATRLNCEFVGPIGGDELTELSDTVHRVRQSGRSTVIYLETRKEPLAAPHFPLSDEEHQSHPAAGSSLREIASRHLLRLAGSNPLLDLFTSDVDPLLPTAWEFRSAAAPPAASRLEHAVEHCAQLARHGRHPFLFLGLDEFEERLPQIRQSILLPRLTVTLVVEARGRSHNDSGSARLSALQNLPQVALASPKDGSELCQLLSWAATEAEPVVIWVPEAEEPPVSWPAGAPIQRGRAEVLGGGTDVTLVAWGTQAAAAAIAAEGLAQRGIGARVINLRFAAPLDVDAVCESARESALVVLIDDAPQGGFAGWLSEQLIERGLGDRVSIVRSRTPQRTNPLPSGAARFDQHSACAAAVVARCEWLAQPVVTTAPNSAAKTARIAPPRDTAAVAHEAWLAHFSRQAAGRAAGRAQVLDYQLSADVRRWADLYQEVGSRDVYLWQWCALGVELTTLPSVRPDLRAHLCDTKMLSIVLCVLLDDVADEHGNGQLLETLLELTCRPEAKALPELDVTETRHAEITRALWLEYWQRVGQYPLHEEFEPVLRYDLLQFQNTMRYSHLVNERPYLLNLVEHDLYTSHNMMMISFATLDLMCSPEFSRDEIGALREAIWHAQCMGRNGNLLSTWRRELANRDFTSGVFARAIMRGDLTLAELRTGDLATIEQTISKQGHEEYFYQKWLEHRTRCHACARRVHSVDWRPVLAGHDRFFAMHLENEGAI